MKTIENYLFSFYGTALLILAICMVIMMLGSGIGLHLHISSQMLLVGEIFIIFLTAIALLSHKRNFIFGRMAMIVLILLTGTTLADIFIELKNGDAENVIPVLVVLIILMLLDLWILIILAGKKYRRENYIN